MLTINVRAGEAFNNVTGQFVITDEVELQLEHSLVSLSKWEAQFEKPFLSGETKSNEEVLAYISAMSLGAPITKDVLLRLTAEDFNTINTYINSKMTATWFRESNTPRPFQSEVITSEIIYHWIVALQINWDAQYWHLNKLITLVKTINEKNKEATDKKRRPLTSAALAERKSLMEQRRAESAANRQD